MKNIFLITLLAFLSPCLIVAQSTDDSLIIRLNGLYIDKILDGGDSGVGTTIEVSTILGETGDVFQTVGLEIGYITSDTEDSGWDLTTDVIPVLFNYTVGCADDETGLVWEAGVGVGAYIVDLEIDAGDFSNWSDSDNDIIIGGQLFGSFGYKFTQSSSLLAGIRYMIAEDANMLGIEDEVLNSAAFDLSFNFAF